MSNNNKEKTNIKLYDLPLDITKSDIESFLSKYKEQITSISLEDKKTYKEAKKVATISFKDHTSANDCRISMNLRKIKNASIRIIWDEKDFQYKIHTKNNLYIKKIPKSKSSRELFEFFHKFGDIYSIKINEDESGNNIGTGYITYYNKDDAKKAIDETNGKKIWDSNMELLYQNQYKNERNYHYNNYNNHNNDKLKIIIRNLPESMTNQDIQKLCEEFGKVESNNIFNDQNGKYATVIFSNESEAKKAVENLNNKEINGKIIIAKEFQRKYNNNYNNNNINNYYNKQYQKYEESYENASLYIKNIPITAKEEEVRKIFEQFGKIKSIKIEKEIIEKKENNQTKTITLNKGYGYISFETAESAKRALESLNGKYLPGFESWSKPLLIDFFISKQKRIMMDNMTQPNNINFYGLQTGMIFSPAPPYFPQYLPMMRIPFPNQYKMPQNIWYQGNYNNIGHNGVYKPRYNKRGGYRREYYKNNHQSKNNNNQNTTNSNEKDNNNKNENIHSTTTNNEEKTTFDYDSYKKLSNDEEKKDFLGERLFSAIQQSSQIIEKNIDLDTIGRITGMIIEIPDEKEIIEILEKPSVLNSRIVEALSLLNKS